MLNSNDFFNADAVDRNRWRYRSAFLHHNHILDNKVLDCIIIRDSRHLHAQPDNVLRTCERAFVCRECVCNNDSPLFPIPIPIPAWKMLDEFHIHISHVGGLLFLLFSFFLTRKKKRSEVWNRDNHRWNQNITTNNSRHSLVLRILT